MARAAVTILKMTTINSSVTAIPTLAAVDTATGAYIDVSNVDASKMLLIFQKDASATLHNACGDKVIIKDGDSKVGYSAYTLGNLTLNLSSDQSGSTPSTGLGEANICFAGPFETARFKNSYGRIIVDPSTNGVNVSFVGAILI